MPNTARLALPYPVLSDTADVPRDISALATKLDTLIGVPTIYAAGALPKTATTHQLALFDRGDGVWWLGQYNPSRGTIGGWDIMGGQVLDTGPVTITTITAGTGWRRPTTTPTLTLALAGSYAFTCGGDISYSSAAEATGGMGIAVQTVAATATPTIQGIQGAAAGVGRNQITMVDREQTVAAADVMTMRFNTTASNQISADRCYITARPVWVAGII